MTEEVMVAVANYIVDNDATIREAASEFELSKSTVHLNMRKHLKFVNPMLFHKVEVVLDRNKAERHLRGGMATKAKYKKKRT